MDRISNSVMQKISDLTNIGKYVIISEDEFTLNPDDGVKNEIALKKALKNLQTAGYIDIKYSGGDLYCVAPLKKFVPEPEEVKVKKDEKEVVKTGKSRNILYPVLAGFLGSMLGSIVTTLLLAIF